MLSFNVNKIIFIYAGRKYIHFFVVNFKPTHIKNVSTHKGKAVNENCYSVSSSSKMKSQVSVHPFI